MSPILIKSRSSHLQYCSWLNLCLCAVLELQFTRAHGSLEIRGENEGLEFPPRSRGFGKLRCTDLDSVRLTCCPQICCLPQTPVLEEAGVNRTHCDHQNREKALLVYWKASFNFKRISFNSWPKKEVTKLGVIKAEVWHVQNEYLYQGSSSGFVYLQACSTCSSSSIFRTERNHNPGIRRLKWSYEIEPAPKQNRTTKPWKKWWIGRKNRCSESDLESDSTRWRDIVKSIEDVSWQKELKLIDSRESNSHTILITAISFARERPQMSSHILHFPESQRDLLSHHVAVLGKVGGEEEKRQLTIRPCFSEFNHFRTVPWCKLVTDIVM